MNCPDDGYDEDARFHPRSPYGVAKMAAYWSVVNFREAYGLHASNGILFNHESPRRGSDFVTRKITLAVGAIARGETDHITLGNIDAERDWGYAGDYVKAMAAMCDNEVSGDWVVATGESYSVRDFLILALDAAGLDGARWEEYVRFDPRYMRPSEVPVLKGNPAKIKADLGWEPEHDLGSLVNMMVQHDLIRS